MNDRGMFPVVVVVVYRILLLCVVAGHKFPVSIPCENNCYMNVHLWSYNINTSSHFYFHFEMDILTWRDTYKVTYRV